MTVGPNGRTGLVHTKEKDIHCYLQHKQNCRSKGQRVDDTLSLDYLLGRYVISN
jgi:hypothetical protein